ncbi:MAG: hypothetical protein SFY69_04920 [Planctomycetota bacterium]|nr:hypothetical protein [Planctomycetota bacterium]
MQFGSMARTSCVGLLCALAGRAAGQQTFSNYIGPNNGLWSSVVNWDNGVPNVATEVPLIPGGAIVTLDTFVTVDKVGGSPGSRINVNNGALLGVVTQSDGTGTTGIFSGRTIALNTIGAGTYVRLSGAPGTYAVHGPSDAVIEMNGPAAVIDASSSGVTLVNQGTIRGSGSFGANLLNIENSGFVRATRAGETLTIDPASTFLNTGSMTAEGGTLSLNAGTYTQTSPGEIGVVGGSGVVMANGGATIIGGRFFSGPNGTERMEVRGAVFRDFTIEGRVIVPNGNIMYLENALHANSGSCRLESIGAGTYIRLLNNVEIGTNMAFTSTNSAANIVDGQVVGLTLTNSIAQGIEMAGQLGQNTLNFVNNTTISAAGSAGLAIDPAATLVNNGTLRALTGSTLTLNPGTYTNTNHFIEAQPNSTVVLNACTVVGGTLNTAGPTGSVTLQTCTLQGVSTSATTSVNINNGNLAHASGGLTNHGTISLNSIGAGTYLRVLENMTLSGSGVLSLSNSSPNIIDAQVSNLVLTNASTIRGSGRLCDNSLALVNSTGLIEAQGSAGLTIDPPSGGFTNTSTVRALTGSLLSLVSGSFDNAGGLLEVQAGASGTVTACTVTGGIVRSLGSGVWVLGGSSSFGGVTFQGTINTVNGNLNFFTGPIVNEGTYGLSSIGAGTYLRVGAPEVIMTGGGVVQLSNSSVNIIDAQVVNNRLVLNNQTIRGSGRVGDNSLVIVNNSLIEAQGSAGMVLDPPSGGMENNSTVRALSGSSLTLTNGAFDNADGLFVVEAGGSGLLTAATMTGGVVRAIGSGVWSWTGSSAMSGLTLEGSHSITNGNLVFARGTIDNRGTLSLSSIGAGTYLRIDTPVVTLIGGGTLQLSNSAVNLVDAQVLGNTLVVQNQTVRGAGQIGANTLAVVNRGSIIADATNAIVIDPPGASGGFLNDTGGTLRVQGAGGIQVVAGPFENRGTVLVDALRKLDRTSDAYLQTAGVTRVYGELEVDSDVCTINGGRVEGTGVLDSNTTNNGGVVSPGDDVAPGTLAIQGTYTQGAGGTLEVQIGGAQAGAFDVLSVSGAAALGGTLRVRLVFAHQPSPGNTYDIMTMASRNGTFAMVDAPGFQVDYFNTFVRLTYIAPQCDPDFNQDGNVDQDDIDCLVQAVAGDTGCSGADPDFNRDGNVDQDDIEALTVVVAGGQCPL